MPNQSGARRADHDFLHPRIVRVARRLRNHRWVDRHCSGDVSAATDRLAMTYGFERHETMMVVLCLLLESYPDRESFDREVARLFDEHRPR